MRPADAAHGGAPRRLADCSPPPGARGADPAAWWGLPAAVRRAPGARRPTTRSRSARRRSSRSAGASCAGSSSTSAAATARARRRTSAPSSTRWPRPRRTPRRRTEEALQARLHAAAAHGATSAPAGSPRKEREKAEAMVRRLARLAGREPPRGRGDRARLRGRGRPGAARWPGRPDRARRPRPGRGHRPQDRHVARCQPDELPTHGQLATYQLAVESRRVRRAGPHRERRRRAACRSARPAASTYACSSSRHSPS